MRKKSAFSLPLPVTRALRKLGNDIKSARLRRRISTQMMAERASISRTTLYKVERGDPTVAMWVYSNVLFVLGFIKGVEDLADHIQDKTGLYLEDEKLPQRIVGRRASSS